jgi:hypothetical protein
VFPSCGEGEQAAVGLGEPGVLALAGVAQDRGVQGRLGVLPPGLDQSPSAVMASTIALQFMGSPASARTWIAAWN